MDEENRLSEEEAQELDLVEMEDEDGNVFVCEIVDYFFYNGEEYAVFAPYVPDEELEADAGEEPLQVDCFIMKVESGKDEDGEDTDVFTPIEDADLEQRLVEIATKKLNEDEEL